MDSPLAIDLFCGLGGWTEGLLAEGYDVIGFDIERHDYGTGGYPAQLVLQDVLTLHGAQFKDAALIVASPPCQEYSYMAMPWSLAKEKRKKILADKAEQERLNRLFNACFRIQREACDAAGHHIPMGVENVRGAQEWVGLSRWNFGSFHLWGDVPALMPIAKAIKVDDGRKNSGGSWFNIGSPGQKEVERNPVHEITKQGLKQAAGIKNGGNGSWFGDYSGVKQGGDLFDDPASFSRRHSSKSKARKAASAAIAKIPLPLSRHIAKYWHPQNA